MIEFWEEIEGHKNYYVSNLGRVKSSGKHGRNPLSGKFIFKDKILKPSITNWGYKRVVLQYKGNRKHMRVHRLVAMSFITNPDNKPQINHLDGNKLNNCINNLEWCTAKENHHHAIKNNLKPIHGNPTGINQFTKNKIK